MDRKTALYSLSTHPWLKRTYAKLEYADLQICYDFIASNNHLGKAEFDYAINRMHLDNPSKPKFWTHMEELLSCSNTKAFS